MGALGFQSLTITHRSDRPSDSLRCAVATAVQCPSLTAVPGGQYADLVLGGMPPVLAAVQVYCDLAAWLARKGIRLVTHASPPWDRELWVGLGVTPLSRVARAVVLSGRTIVHDPTPSLPALSRIDHGLTFE
jgi:hypothetical protein